MSGEIWLPIATNSGLPPHLQNLARSSGFLAPSLSVLGDMDQIYKGGRAARPVREIVLVGPDGETPIMIPGMGESEIAEIEEIAQAAYEKAAATLARTGSVIDFAAERERRGLPPAEKFDELYKTALEDRIQNQRKNPTDYPSRDFARESGLIKGQGQVAMPALPWKEPASDASNS